MSNLPIIPATVIGSWSFPGWYARLCDDAVRQPGTYGPDDLEEAVRDAVRLAVDDQLRAGADIITDGEMQRVDFNLGFYELLTGLQSLPQRRLHGPPAHDQRSRYRCVAPLAAPQGLGLVDEYQRLRDITTAAIKMPVPGPFTLAGCIQGGEVYRNRSEITEALLPIVNREMKELVRLGVHFIQIDEPSFACHADEPERFLDIIARTLEGVAAKTSLHMCFGNYRGRAVGWRSYRPLFPHLARAAVDQLALEFASREMSEIELAREIKPPKELAVGLIDVKNTWVEPPELIAERLRMVLKHIEPERVHVTPDCGFSQTTRSIACRKLANMTAGVRLVRNELTRTCRGESTISSLKFIGSSKGAAMISRRNFLKGVGTTLVARSLAAAQPARQNRKKLAIVTTEWRDLSHAWHMGERFLAGYPINGRWHRPPIDVVSAYVDQTPKNDLSRDRALEFGFRIHPTIREALRCGTDQLAVDAVLLIGEHGNYPTNEIGQKQYPRYEYFQQVVDVFKKDGRTVPVFNDKHLSWKWEWAKAMVDTAAKLGFPFLAGSSLPVTWRMPAIDLPYGAEVEEVLCVAIGRVDSYDFHALEVIQCMAERRRGGETGVAALQALRGEAVWNAQGTGSWKAGGWDPALLEACLCRSQTLAQAPAFSHRYPGARQMREWVKEPVAYRFEYADGLMATMLLLNGLVGDFTFAARIKGQAEPLSTLFYLPPTPNVVYSAALMSKAEEMFLTGKAPYPIERTLLTTGLVAAGMASLAGGQRRLETPHLAVRYVAPRESAFWHR